MSSTLYESPSRHALIARSRHCGSIVHSTVAEAPSVSSARTSGASLRTSWRPGNNGACAGSRRGGNTASSRAGGGPERSR
jgi:hypothetical protein